MENIEDYLKIINSLSYCINFHIDLNKDELLIFNRYYDKFKDNLSLKYKNLSRIIIEKSNEKRV